MIVNWLLLLLLAGSLIAGEAEIVQVHPFGSVFPGSLVRHDFVFRNDGQTAWRVGAVSATCSCGKPKNLPQSVAPGESLTVPVVYQVGMDRRRGFGGDVRVEISGGDSAPQRLVARFTLEAHGLLQLPGRGRVVLAPVPADGPPVVTRYPLARDSHPAPWDALAVKVTAGADALAAEVSPDPERPGDWNLNVTLTPHGFAGVLPSQVELVCSQAGKALPFSERLTVIARVTGAVRADPASLLFGALTTRDRRTFRVLPDASTTMPELNGITVSDPAHASARIQPDGSIEVTLDPGVIKEDRQASGQLELQFSGGSRLRVPYFAAFSAEPAPR